MAVEEGRSRLSDDGLAHDCLVFGRLADGTGARPGETVHRSLSELLLGTS